MIRKLHAQDARSGSARGSASENGVSGVMSFIVSHDGAAYEKNPGKETEKVAGAMKKFNPEKTWEKVE